MKQKRSRPMAITTWDVPLDPAEPIWADANYELSDRPITQLHVHRCLELGCCHEGHGVFVIADKVRTFATGDVVIITSAEPHLARSAPGTKSRWTWIYLDPAKLVPPGAAEPRWLDTAALCGPDFANVFKNREQPALARAVFRLAEELAGDALGRSLAVRALVLEILVQAHRLKPAGAVRRIRPDYERLAPALQVLTRDSSKSLRMGALAKRCGLSEPQFRRVFLQAMGCSPLGYLNDLRVQTAASLLRGTGKSVLEVSLESGFESVSSLHRAFRARLGTTPRAWRYADGVTMDERKL
jgi:AraC-like DNA-binding protein